MKKNVYVRLSFYFIFVTNILAFHSNESIVFNKKYVIQFRQCSDTNIKYIEVEKFIIFNTSITLFNVDCIVKEPGDFIKAIIKKPSDTEITFQNFDGWVKVPSEFRKYTNNPYFIPLNIGSEEPVLIFFGYTYASSPGWLTIISLQGPEPEIIYNQEVDLAKIVKNGKTYKIIVDDGGGFFYEKYIEKYKNGALISRKPKVKNPYKFCSEIYIENNELKIVPCTRTLEDDRKEELEEKKKPNQVK